MKLLPNFASENMGAVTGCLKTLVVQTIVQNIQFVLILFVAT